MTEERKASFNTRMTRRRFVGTGAALAGAAALAGYLPDRLLTAAAAAPRGSAGNGFDLSQVKHVVLLMQENRSFDHYFGTYPGIRGFSDPTAVRLPDGRSVFQQPDPGNPDGYLEPYHMSTITTGAAAVPSLSHNWQDQHASWNYGRMDGWLMTHTAVDGELKGSYTMGHYEQDDIPFHWALAQTFRLLDNYHCSVLGPTDPNRSFWQNGTNDPQGLGGGPILETVTPPPMTLQSGIETMYNAGISCKFYQWAGNEWDVWAWFAKFQATGLAPAALYNSVWGDGTLWGNGTPGGLGNPADPTPATVASLAFDEDCANGVLPDVSFLGTGASEHPPAIPAAGAQFIAQKLEALASNEDLWNTTVFILNYDENDGFFDHVPPPIPNQEEYPEEYVTRPSVAGTPGGDFPIGAGFRVPAWIISPWTVGGQPFSALGDHTSCLQFIEDVANAGGLSGQQTSELHFPYISRWRRATFNSFAQALVPGAPKEAPDNPQFNASTRAAELASQQTSSELPLPPFPGATQTPATQVK